MQAHTSFLAAPACEAERSAQPSKGLITHAATNARLHSLGLHTNFAAGPTPPARACCLGLSMSSDRRTRSPPYSCCFRKPDAVPAAGGGGLRRVSTASSLAVGMRPPLPHCHVCGPDARLWEPLGWGLRPLPTQASAPTHGPATGSTTPARPARQAVPAPSGGQGVGLRSCGLSRGCKAWNMRVEVRVGSAHSAPPRPSCASPGTSPCAAPCLLLAARAPHLLPSCAPTPAPPPAQGPFSGAPPSCASSAAPPAARPAPAAAASAPAAAAAQRACGGCVCWGGGRGVAGGRAAWLVLRVAVTGRVGGADKPQTCRTGAGCRAHSERGHAMGGVA